MDSLRPGYSSDRFFEHYWFEQKSRRRFYLSVVRSLVQLKNLFSYLSIKSKVDFINFLILAEVLNLIL